MSNLAELYLANRTLSSSTSDMMCGRTLIIGETYVIMGSSPTFTVCDDIRLVSTLTLFQKVALSRFYKLGCDCKVNLFII